MDKLDSSKSNPLNSIKPFLDKKRILLLLWHPNTKAISSGGFIRIREFLKVIPDDFTIDVLDNYTTILKKEKNIRDIYQYKIPKFITYIEKKSFLLGRLSESIVIFFKIVKKGSYLNKSRRYDVIYVPTGETFTALAAILLCTLFKVKVVIDCLNIEMPTETGKDYYRNLRQSGYTILHSITVPLYIRLFRPILIKFFNKADYIVTVSPFLKKKLHSFGVKTHIDFTPSGIDYAYFALAPKHKKIYDGIFIGRHELTKGIFDLINVWKIIAYHYPSAILRMIGYCDNSTYNNLMKKIKKDNLENNIIIVGEVSEDEKIKNLKQSKIYIHLALMEPLFPVISILEGLACGLPLVGYDVTAYQDIDEIHHNRAIALVPVGDYRKAGLEIIKYLQLSQSEVDKVSYTAQEYAKRFDWKQIAEKQFNIVRNTVRSGAG